MDNEKAIRAAKLTLGGILEKRRAKTAVDRAQGQIAPSKYLPGVPRQAHAAGGYVPSASLPVPKLAVARPLQQAAPQPTMFDALTGLASLGEKARGVADLVSQDKGAESPAAAAPEALSLAAKQIGMNENTQRDALKDYLATGGANLDPATTAWCAAFVNSTLQQTGGQGTGSNMARSFLDWGQSVDQPQPGDVAVFSRGDPNGPYGHVGFFQGYDENGNILVLGGNQGDAVSVSPYSPDRLLGFRRAYADGGEVADLGQAREQKQLRDFHGGMMNDIRDRMTDAMEAHQKAVDQGVFDGYEVGDVLQANAGPMRITGKFMAPWKPTKFALQNFERMKTQPTIIEHNGRQYIPMLRYQTGREGDPDWQEGHAYLDGVKAAGYPKMGGLRAVKADGGSVDDLPPVGWNRNGVPEDDAVASPLRRAEYPYMAMVPARQVYAEPLRQAINKAHAEAKVMDLPIDQIVTDVSAIGRSKVKNPAGGLPFVERINGVHHLRDGNHRVAAAMLRGDKTVRALVADMDEAIKANGRADGGSVAERSPMFEGMHEDLLDEEGKPMELWHGTQGQPFEAFDDKKIGQRDAGFYGRGHYLTPTKGNAEGYADPDEMGTGSVMGPLHAALKNPFIWDTSDKGSHRTLRDLQSMGIMKGQAKLEPWDNLQRHHIDPFMREMQRRGHDGVLMKTNRGLQEIVVFNPNMIKHRDAEVGDPNDPRIMRNRGGKVDLYSKAAKVIRGLKDQPMDVADIVKYALGKGVKNAEIAHSDIPPGKARPSQVAEHIEFMQPQIGVVRKGEARGLTPEEDAEFTAITAPGAPVPSGAAMERYRELSAKLNPDTPAQYAQYQLPNGQNYREHILTLDNHPEGQKFVARNHWGKLENPLAHIRMSDRIIPPPHEKMMEIFDRVMSGGAGIDGALEKGLINQKEAATLARNFGMTESLHYDKPGLERKVLHVEEMQSDWNNAARASGFRTGRERQDYDDYVANMRRQMVDRINAGDASPMIKDALLKKAEAMDPYMLAMKLGVQAEHNDMARRANENLMAPPKAPYINPKRDDWAELAMKHVLTEAAKGGYDGVAFTPDAEQSARWGGTNFDGIYDKKLPGMAHRLVQQHDPETRPDTVSLPSARGGNDASAAMIPLSQDARDSIMKNSFPSFRRGGYVTHIRRGK